MAKTRKTENSTSARAGQSAPVAPERSVTESAFSWSPLARRITSVILIVYLVVLLLGPLANPVGSEFLTRPLAQAVAPLHRLLFLGHGYRFFGPDPGPSHLVVYRITDAEGQPREGHFPDREKNWPRLLYHRWFMLGETVFQEHALTPDQKSFAATDAELEAQIKELRLHGKFNVSDRLIVERQRRAEQYAATRRRIEELVWAIANQLLRQYDGTRIELFVQERNIPFPVQVLTGSQLEDAEFLSPLRKIGEFQINPQGETVSLELPVEATEDGR
jgi:hypothetical protein